MKKTATLADNFVEFFCHENFAESGKNVANFKATGLQNQRAVLPTKTRFLRNVQKPGEIKDPLICGQIFYTCN